MKIAGIVGTKGFWSDSAAAAASVGAGLVRGWVDLAIGQPLPRWPGRWVVGCGEWRGGEVGGRAVGSRGWPACWICPFRLVDWWRWGITRLRDHGMRLCVPLVVMVRFVLGLWLWWFRRVTWRFEFFVCVCDVVVQSGKKRINVCVFMLFFFCCWCGYICCIALFYQI